MTVASERVLFVSWARLNVLASDSLVMIRMVEMEGS